MKLSALILLFFAAALEVAADNKPSLKIVHIGDSYSSGNGASKLKETVGTALIGAFETNSIGGSKQLTRLSATTLVSRTQI